MSNIILSIFFQNCKNVQNLVIFGNQSNVEKLSLNEVLVMTERLESFRLAIISTTITSTTIISTIDYFTPYKINFIMVNF